MRYEPNPKHKEPWQRGRRGSLCPQMAPDEAAQLLLDSEMVGEKRYATAEGRAYCAKEHGEDIWHGWPVGWKEVPPPLRLQWRRADKIKKSDVKRYWDSHDG